MNVQDRGALAGDRPTMAGWYAARRNHYFMERRTIGGLGLFEFFQPDGSFHKPGMDMFLLQVALSSDGHVTLDMGGDRPISARPLPGSFVRAAPGARTTYDLPVDTHGIAIELDTTRLRLLAAELDPRFDGHFAPLYSRMWRDHQLRDDVLRLWRAAKGDAGAPMVDADAGLMTLTRRLLGGMDPARHSDDTARRLAPMSSAACSTTSKPTSTATAASSASRPRRTCRPTSSPGPSATTWATRPTATSSHGGFSAPPNSSAALRWTSPKSRSAAASRARPA